MTLKGSLVLGTDANDWINLDRDIILRLLLGRIGLIMGLHDGSGECFIKVYDSTLDELKEWLRIEIEEGSSYSLTQIGLFKEHLEVMRKHLKESKHGIIYYHFT